MQVESKKGKTRFTKTLLPACDDSTYHL